MTDRQFVWAGLGGSVGAAASVIFYGVTGRPLNFIVVVVSALIASAVAACAARNRL